MGISIHDDVEELIDAAATDEDKSEEVRESFKTNNVDRAKRALMTMQAYWDGDGNEGLETVLGDMMCDLRHLCRLTGMDFHSMSERGRINSDEERRGIY